jgi:cbb3-type cytochrome oxidase subunit 3
MSDFNANFWSVYVAGATVLSIIACLLLLWITARKTAPVSADNTTGHVWDEDLREANNPMPRWWPISSRSGSRSSRSMQMDITTLRIAATLVSFVTFLGILAWAFSRRRAKDFEDAGRLPLEQD